MEEKIDIQRLFERIDNLILHAEAQLKELEEQQRHEAKDLRSRINGMLQAQDILKQELQEGHWQPPLFVVETIPSRKKQLQKGDLHAVALKLENLALRCETSPHYSEEHRNAQINKSKGVRAVLEILREEADLNSWFEHVQKTVARLLRI